MKFQLDQTGFEPTLTGLGTGHVTNLPVYNKALVLQFQHLTQVTKPVKATSQFPEKSETYL